MKQRNMQRGRGQGNSRGCWSPARGGRHSPSLVPHRPNPTSTPDKGTSSSVSRIQEIQNSHQPMCSIASHLGNKCNKSSFSSLPGSKSSHTSEERTESGEIQREAAGDVVTLKNNLSDKLHISCKHGEADTVRFPKYGDSGGPSPIRYPETPVKQWKPDNSEYSVVHYSFDLCPPKIGSAVKLKPSLLVQNKEKRNEVKQILEGKNGTILRPGMILLKNCISRMDQVKIVKLCRDLGLGYGGFYQPGYRDGAQLNLRMMCLGKNWDPQTRKYGDHRPFDGAKPPSIPVEFLKLVEKAIKDSDALMQIGSKPGNAEVQLPQMSPNICLVNFYTANGRLGLHQDRDESPESLQMGFPVVSFSIGDAAEFLYGDERDVDKARKIVLESGDVLIFGGKSRLIYHGVTAILPNTAPKTLLEETNLRCGRLNLTFRQY